MKILTAEVNLRDETRALQQAKPQTEVERYNELADAMSVTQEEILNRTNDVIEKIFDLPEGEQKFGKEIQQLSNAADAMEDAVVVLGRRDTGPDAIAAETEAIEWLLQAKRSGSGGGGGGGSPGGGNRTGQNLNGSALASLGDSTEKQANSVERETNQATGKSGRELPEEFRAGLDQYFESLEKNSSQQ